MSVRAIPSLFRARKLLFESFMPRCELLTYSQLKQTKRYSTDSKKKIPEEKNEEEKEPNLCGAAESKYAVFADQDSPIIFDATEELHINVEELQSHVQKRDPYEGLNLKRGITGVYDLEDLIAVLKRDNAKDIFVASVPAELSYVDYIVLVTGKSRKHMRAIADFVHKGYKLKKRPNDILPRIEGKDSNDWIALDLGNIALHIFSTSARSNYDLETLWTVGSQYDDKSNVRSNLEDVMEQYNTFLADFQPADDQLGESQPDDQLVESQCNSTQLNENSHPPIQPNP